MKQIFLSAIALLITAFSFAQVPQLVNYQAVARNTNGQALASQSIKVRLSVNENGSTTFYTETRNVMTNALGLFSVQIGATGAVSSTGSLNATNWLDATKTRNLKVELDPNNSGTFIDMGSQQLVSVPYALAAGTAQVAEVAKKVVSPFIGFRAVPTEQYQEWITSTSNDYIIKLKYRKYDSSNVFNTTTEEFTAPESGMYCLHANLALFNSVGASNLRMAIQFVSNTKGVITAGTGDDMFGLDGIEYNIVNHGFVTFLSQGEKIICKLAKIAMYTSGSPIVRIDRDAGTFFEAYKIN